MPIAGPRRLSPRESPAPAGRCGLRRCRMPRSISTPAARTTIGHEQPRPPSPARPGTESAQDRRLGSRARARLRDRGRARRSTERQPATRFDDDAGTNLHAPPRIVHGHRDNPLTTDVRKRKLWVGSARMAREVTSTRLAHSSEPDWLTLGQAAKYLGVAQSTIRKWSDHGRVPAFYTPGGHRRYRRGDLDNFLERSGPGGRVREGPVVLIVDDDPGLRAFVRARLELEGYAVREAASADEGLAALEEGAPDLILLDVMMPRVDGWEMLRMVQERHGVGAIPVLMFSGKVDAASASEASSLGAQGFIGKPFDPQQLIESTKQMLPT